MPYDPSQYPEWGESQRLFSIFIPTYNRARLLNRALEICARQTFRDFEVVVIDDGSTDDTASVLREWGERADFRLRWQRQEVVLYFCCFRISDRNAELITIHE